MIEVDKKFVIWFVLNEFDMKLFKECEKNFVKVYDGKRKKRKEMLYE